MANVNQSESMARSLVLARQEIESQSGIIADYHGRVAKMEAADREQRQRIAELEQQLAETKAEMKKKAETYKAVIDSVFDGMECSPSCDSYGHAADCPDTEGPIAFLVLRGKMNKLADELETSKARSAGLEAELAAWKEKHAIALKGQHFLRLTIQLQESNYTDLKAELQEANGKLATQAVELERATARSADMVEWPRCKAADESRKMRCERPEGHEGHHYLVTAQEWRAIFPLE